MNVRSFVILVLGASLSSTSRCQLQQGGSGMSGSSTASSNRPLLQAALKAAADVWSAAAANSVTAAGRGGGGTLLRIVGGRVAEAGRYAGWSTFFTFVVCDA